MINISKELTAGYIVGSESYFRYINEETFLGKIMSDKGNFMYHYELEKLASNIYYTVDEVYEDLRKYNDMLHNIPEEKSKTRLNFCLDCMIL